MKSLILTLANLKELYERVQGFHWNVEGINFPEYHRFFGDLYSEIYESIDPLAEQIRASGQYVPYGFKLSEMTTLPESKQFYGSNIVDMLRDFSICNQMVIESYNKSLSEVENNQGLIDYITSRIDAHQKIKWMVDSCLK